MLVALSLSVLLGAAPTLASPDFATLNVSEATARFCNEHLANQLESRGVRVTTARQIATLLGIERQKQLAGCAEDGTSCMAELAAALGADAVLLGDLGKLGDTFQVNLRIVRSNGAGVVATWSRSVSNEAALLSVLTEAAEALAPRLRLLFRTASDPVPTRFVRTWPVAPTVVAGALAIAGGALLTVAGLNYDRLSTATPRSMLSLTEVDQLVTVGEWTRGFGVGALIGAGVTLGVSVLIYFLSGHEEPLQALLGTSASGLRWGLR